MNEIESKKLAIQPLSDELVAKLESVHPTQLISNAKVFYMQILTPRITPYPETYHPQKSKKLGLKRANSENTIEDKKATEFREVETSRPKDEVENVGGDKKASESASTETRGKSIEKP